MSMTTGEFDYSGIFRLAPSGADETFEDIPFPPVSYVLWILFIILMPILLTNMLVHFSSNFVTCFNGLLYLQIGLAVDNIKETLNGAVVKKRAWRVMFSLHSLTHSFTQICYISIPDLATPTHISTIIPFTIPVLCIHSGWASSECWRSTSYLSSSLLHSWKSWNSA